MVKRLKHSRSQWFCFSKWIKTTWCWVHSSRNTGSAPDPFISPVAWMASSDGKLGKMILLHVLFWHSTYVVMIESSWGFCIQKQKLKTLDEQIDTGVHSHSERGTWFVSAESSCASHYRVVGEVTETSAAPCSTCGGLGVDLWSELDAAGTIRTRQMEEIWRRLEHDISTGQFVSLWWFFLQLSIIQYWKTKHLESWNGAI